MTRTDHDSAATHTRSRDLALIRQALRELAEAGDNPALAQQQRLWALIDVLRHCTPARPSEEA